VVHTKHAYGTGITDSTQEDISAVNDRQQYQMQASATAFGPHTIDWRLAPCTLPFKNVDAATFFSVAVK